MQDIKQTPAMNAALEELADFSRAKRELTLAGLEGFYAKWLQPDENRLAAICINECLNQVEFK
ncbi:hypothetical protein NB640_12500 [Oxalobacter vibrioformis]|uniref:Uncharacterized protein n=1 Tax=Oxalobacter vibrioformis TaxID=933080 RepID=A0A9E9P3H7_9BURK|nr:hypothetical protein [Oxalobacter vibrioformis]WAW10018.1 hypothetical protein NB640_12500 [Oxalobacter vibrioformis]